MYLQSFEIEKSSGLKSYTLSAKHLSILYGDGPDPWTWKSIPNSRFQEVAELKIICRLEIEGRIKRGILLPNTKYGAYMVIKISDGAFGLDSRPFEMSIKVGNKEAISSIAYLSSSQDRRDGWMEFELGEFFNNGEEDDDNDEITIGLFEVKGCHVKGGLIVQGIEIKPEVQS